jgi:hypothetical protein
MSKIDLFQQTPLPLRDLLIKTFLPSPYRKGNDKYSCIFIHIPRTGGTSIATALYGELFGHPYFEEFLAHDPEKASRYFKFTIVRNPWDRLVSCYAQMQKENNNPIIKRRYKPFKNLSFEELIYGLQFKKSRSRIWQIPHFRPQTRFLSNSKSLSIDYVGKFEQLDLSIAQIESQLGINLEILHLNRAQASNQNYQEFYNVKMKEIVAKVYSEDIEAFDYTF